MRPILTGLATIVLSINLSAQPRPLVTNLDADGDTTVWKSFRSAGVVSTLIRDSGTESKALWFDVQFPKGSGYGGVFRSMDLPLPDDYQIVFSLRATVPVNNFEVKVSDDSLGENVWWVNQKMFTYPADWKRIVVKKRHLEFAWGPRPGPSPSVLKRIELVVTAGTGGQGSVWIDDMEVQALPPVPSPLPFPKASASSGSGSAKAALPGKKGAWSSDASARGWWQVDWGYRREFGGVEIEWDRSHEGLNFLLLSSDDGRHFDTLRRVESGSGGKVVVFTPESEARYLRVQLQGMTSRGPLRLWSVDVIGSDSMSTRNQYIQRLARDVPRGLFPRSFLKEMSYWTVVGVPEGRSEALINEDGAFEIDKQGFSLEPFVWLERDRRLLTWADGTLEQSLEGRMFPIPTVRRRHPTVELAITLLASGTSDAASLAARYVLKNTSSAVEKGSLVLAIRPFQINPPSQWLNFDGGASSVRSIRCEGPAALIDGRVVRVSGDPAAGATTIDAGEISMAVAAGRLPAGRTIEDVTGFGSAAFRWPFTLAPEESLVCVAAVPWTSASPWADRSPGVAEFEEILSRERDAWRHRVQTIRWDIPPSARRVFEVVHSTLAYILINMDGPGFQPGSRSYERSWIRDGSMTSAALLKYGMPEIARDFMAWYAPYQYESGMVPCVVDRRGPDPVPEHDSNGQLIFGLMEVYRFTKDTAFLRQHFGHIVRAVEFIQSLREQRMTAVYRDGDDEQRAFYGLVTESISHEGYSAKPMHSYWDNFFALKGLKDAADAAEIVGESHLSRRYDSLATAFRSELYTSIALAMKNRKIDYLPGCVELGDFDATSTSIALFPGGEFRDVPQEPLRRTFDKYYEWFQQRARGELSWDAYTPYEVRNIGTFVYLGQKERAHTMLDWFLRDQRPPAWNHWAEVVWRDDRLPRFIGDMPHTWVGSDFLNAVRGMFLYERDDDGTIVVGAGLRDEWVKEGIGVEALPTHAGILSLRVNAPADRVVTIRLSGTVDVARHPLLVSTGLLSLSLRGASVNGLPVVPADGYVRVTRLPATVEMAY